jgi:hypothetical protein
MTNLRARLVRLLLIAAAPFLVVACDAGTPPKYELKFVTDSFSVRISPESRPTRALEPVYWHVTIHDRKTGTPIQGGQGRIFATSKDKKTISNGLEETGELGTSRTHLMYVTAGLWAHGLQFRRDSTLPLQRTEDWTQDILAGDEPGENIPTDVKTVDTTKSKASDTTKKKSKGS